MAFLVKAFLDDYMVKKLALEYAGWRSLMDVVNSLNIPKYQVYGDPRSGHTFGKSLKGLIRTGIVEHRIVPRSRGRGGNVVNIRVAYERQPVKELINSLSLRPLAGQQNIVSEKSISPQ